MIGIGFADRKGVTKVKAVIVVVGKYVEFTRVGTVDTFALELVCTPRSFRNGSAWAAEESVYSRTTKAASTRDEANMSPALENSLH